MLLNLLVAMLSNTYDENYKEAQQGWKLHRASLLVSVDQSMTSAQRRAPDKAFWQTAPADMERRCVLVEVFTTEDLLEDSHVSRGVRAEQAI